MWVEELKNVGDVTRWKTVYFCKKCDGEINDRFKLWDACPHCGAMSEDIKEPLPARRRARRKKMVSKSERWNAKPDTIVEEYRD